MVRLEARNPHCVADIDTPAAHDAGGSFVALAGEQRIVFDTDTRYVPEEPRLRQRKASLEDDSA